MNSIAWIHIRLVRITQNFALSIKQPFQCSLTCQFPFQVHLLHQSAYLCGYCARRNLVRLPSPERSWCSLVGPWLFGRVQGWEESRTMGRLERLPGGEGYWHNLLSTGFDVVTGIIFSYRHVEPIRVVTWRRDDTNLSKIVDC
jgi:hypothetical protein